MTPVTRTHYAVGVPQAGRWREVLNSDAGIYGGSNAGNGGAVATDAAPAHGHDQSLDLTLPPLSLTIFRFEG